tara:strand:+ start:843 stop:995 length:153 start_codon:yes stop_codon:yes gene_type:complete
MMDFETHERLSLMTQIRHIDAKIQFLEERIQHLDKIINILTKTKKGKDDT